MEKRISQSLPWCELNKTDDSKIIQKIRKELNKKIMEQIRKDSKMVWTEKYIEKFW